MPSYPPRRFNRRAAALLTLCLAMLLRGTAARATIDSGAQRVVERHVAATGGSAALIAESSVRMKATITAFGLTGAVESWGARPAQSASVTTIGPFTLKQGDDGTVVWRIDQNGKYAVLDGKDLEDERAATWFVNEMWALSGQGGGDVRVAGSESDSLGRYTVLEVKPPQGRSRRLWFDDRSGLLVRSINKNDSRVITDRLSDYRPFAGRQRPALTVVAIEGMPLNDARIVLDSAWVNSGIPATVLHPQGGASDSGAVTYLGARGHARIPFRYSAHHVWVKASVDGGPLEDFLIDTGASVSVIDSAYAAARGLKSSGRVQVSGAGSSSGGASFAEVRELWVPGPDGDGVRMGTQKVAVLSLGPFLEPFFWRPIAGVLGYDFVGRFVTTVDYDLELLTLDDPATFVYHGHGAALPMNMAGNIPVIDATLDGRYSGKFRVDVGSGSTVDLHGPFVAANGLREQTGKKVTALGGGFGGTFSSDLTRMKRMTIGPYGWDQPLVILSGATTGGLASEDYAGNIGNRVLDRFRVTLDYERRLVYLEPGQRFDRPDAFSLAGVQLAKTDGAVRAMQVLAGSAAELADVREGDEIVAIDGKPIASWTLDQVEGVFEDGKPGDRHTLTRMRNGKKKTVRLTLAPIL